MPTMPGDVKNRASGRPSGPPREASAFTSTQIAAAQRGDRNAIDLLLRALQDPWYRLSLSLLNDPERARDCTQETAIRFLRQLPSFQRASAIQTWSFGIAINVAREMRRRMARERSPGGQVERPEQCEHRDPLDRLSAREEHNRIQQLLLELPDRQREAIVLRFFEEMSVQQTAEAMGCAPGTIKATIHQAVRSLRRRLSG